MVQAAPAPVEMFQSPAMPAEAVLKVITPYQTVRAVRAVVRAVVAMLREPTEL